MTGRKQDYTPASVFRRHAKADDATLIRLVYYFCNGIGIEPVSKTLDLSRKTVRAHYLDLRKRLGKPKFGRWHSAYKIMPMIADPETEQRIKGGLIEALAVCYFSSCYTNYASGNRKSRTCRRCPLSHSFASSDSSDDAIAAIDQISAFYRRLGLRGQTAPDKLTEFFERLIHASTIQSVQENTRRLPNGLLDPSDHTSHAVGTLLQMLIDDMADDHAPRIRES